MDAHHYHDGARRDSASSACHHVTMPENLEQLQRMCTGTSSVNYPILADSNSAHASGFDQTRRYVYGAPLIATSLPLFCSGIAAEEAFGPLSPMESDTFDTATLSYVESPASFGYHTVGGAGLAPLDVSMQDAHDAHDAHIVTWAGPVRSVSSGSDNTDSRLCQQLPPRDVATQSSWLASPPLSEVHLLSPTFTVFHSSPPPLPEPEHILPEPEHTMPEIKTAAQSPSEIQTTVVTTQYCGIEGRDKPSSRKPGSEAKPPRRATRGAGVNKRGQSDKKKTSTGKPRAAMSTARPATTMHDDVDVVHSNRASHSPDVYQTLEEYEHRVREWHNQIGKKYRNKLNEQFDCLQAILCINASTTKSQQQQTAAPCGESPDGHVRVGRRTINKAKVLAMARERIEVLTEEKAALAAQVQEFERQQT